MCRAAGAELPDDEDLLDQQGGADPQEDDRARLEQGALAYVRKLAQLVNQRFIPEM